MRCSRCEIDLDPEDFAPKNKYECMICARERTTIAYGEKLAGIKFKPMTPFEESIAKHWRQLKSRAKAKGIPFDITKEDLIAIYPDDGKCPVLGIELVWSKGMRTDSSPSVDKLIPELGYVNGNCMFISMRANRIKSNATFKELQTVGAFYGRLCA